VGCHVITSVLRIKKHRAKRSALKIFILIEALVHTETFAQPEHPRLKYQKSHLKIDFLLKFLKTQAKSLVLQFKTPVLKAFHPPQADLCHRFTQ
jgi:hypothetical protein